MDTTITTADEWATALDADSSRYDNVGDQISTAYARGVAAGISVNPGHPAADDERGVIVAANGRWVATWDARNDWWTATDL